MHVPRPSNCVMKTLAWALASPPEGSLAASETSGPADTGHKALPYARCPEGPAASLPRAMFPRPPGGKEYAKEYQPNKGTPPPTQGR
jgi:hypothetical protein